MLVRLLQFSNAESPMLITESGIVMFVRLLQPLNALLPMLVTESGIIISVTAFFSIYLLRTPFFILKPIKITPFLTWRFSFQQHVCNSASVC